MFIKIQKRRVRLSMIESFTQNPTSQQIEIHMASGMTYYSSQKFNVADAKQKLDDIKTAIVNSTDIDL